MSFACTPPGGRLQSCWFLLSSSSSDSVRWLNDGYDQYADFWALLIQHHITPERTYKRLLSLDPRHHRTTHYRITRTSELVRSRVSQSNRLSHEGGDRKRDSGGRKWRNLTLSQTELLPKRKNNTAIDRQRGALTLLPAKLLPTRKNNMAISWPWLRQNLVAAHSWNLPFPT